MNCRMDFFFSKRKFIEILVDIALTLPVTLGIIDILTISSLPIHKHEYLSIYLWLVCFYSAEMSNSLATRKQLSYVEDLVPKNTGHATPDKGSGDREE